MRMRGRLDRIDGLIAVSGQRVAHALAVIDVHLAAIGLDEDLFGLSAGLRAGTCFGSGVRYEGCLCHAGLLAAKSWLENGPSTIEFAAKGGIETVAHPGLDQTGGLLAVSGRVKRDGIVEHDLDI
jgi:hypothetical protein